MVYPILIASLVLGAGALRPLVVWHGLGENCFERTGEAIKKIQKQLPDLYIHCVKMSEDPRQDKRDSLFKPTWEQVEVACENLAADEKLKNGFNALGNSQGGILLRAVIEKCPPSKVNNFITVAAPHQGVFGIPSCQGAVSELLCKNIRGRLTGAAYTRTLQRLVAPATYWHDPTQVEEYIQKSLFLAIYNNERKYNATFKENLLKVEKFVLVRNEEDEVQVPRESSHFAYYLEGQSTEIVNFTETRLYKEDLIGLKELYETGRLEFQTLPGKHVQYTDEWLREIVRTYFEN